MGMYTEFHFNVELKKDVPQEVVEVLKFMLGDIVVEPKLPTHPLFETDRWRVMLGMDSYCFHADTHSTLRLEDIGNCYYLCIRCNLKNYNDEIEKFISWITPYLEQFPGDFLGFSRYEETEQPTLIFMEDGDVQ